MDKGKGGAVAPLLFGAVKLLVNSWPAISEMAELHPYERLSRANRN